MRRTALPLAPLKVFAVALLAATLLAPALAGASPQPSPLCGFCGDRFEDAADDHGMNATVTRSTVIVQVHENGSATWRVRNRLTNGSDQFRDDPSRLSDVGQVLTDGSRGVVNEPRFVSARMDGDTAVLTYRDAEAAERHAGLMVVDYLHHGGYDRWYVVNADDFTIRGPEETVVANDPDSGTVDGSSVTWRGDGGGELYEAPDLEGSPYVVFGPDRSAATAARARAAVALADAPLVVDRLFWILAVQSVVFAAALAVVAAAVQRWTPQVTSGSIATVLAVVAGLGGFLSVVGAGPGSLPGPAVFGWLLGGLLTSSRVRRSLSTPRRQALATTAAVVATWAVLSTVYGASGDHGDPTTVAKRSTALALPFAAMLPLGGALERDHRAILQWGGGAVLGFVAVPLLLVEFTAPLGGMGGAIVAFLTAVGAVLYAVVGAVVLVLGRQLSDAHPADQSTEPRVTDL